jgi:transposase InsO family protein
VGDEAGSPCTATQGVTALDMAVNRQCPAGGRGQRVGLLRDHGSPPPAVGFLRTCSTLEIQQACPSANHPPGHAATERVLRTRKDACRGLQEWSRPVARIKALAGWITDDHAQDLHSARGYQSPRPFARHDDLSHGTPFAAACQMGCTTNSHPQLL